MKKNKHGCLGYIGDYTTQLYGDFNKPLKGSLPNNQDSMESKAVFFRGSSEAPSTGSNVIRGGLYLFFSFFLMENLVTLIQGGPPSLSF